MRCSPPARPFALALALVLAVGGCVPDTWVTVSPRYADAEAAADAPAPLDALANEAGDTSGCCRERPRCVGADGPTHLYRGEGDARDSVGSQHATHNNAVFASGRDGQSFAFGGNRAEQYVALPHEVLDFGDGDFTVSLWFRSMVHGNLISKRAACWGGRAFTGLDLRLTSDGELLMEVWTLSDALLRRAGWGLNDGTWHHVAIIRRGGTLNLDVDGVTASTAPIAGAMRDPTSTPVYLGVGRCVEGAPGWNGHDDGSTWLDGGIDEVAVLGRALSSAEVLEVAQGRCSL